MTRFALVIVGLLMALNQLGVDTTSILARLDVLGLTLGFAAQNSLSNVISGLFIFWDRPFVLGDLVEADGHGAVEEPFESLDFTYFWYPTDRITFKAKAQNILGETVQIERAGVITFEEDPGTVFSISVSWAL